MKKAQHWHGLLEVLIRQAEIEGKQRDRAAAAPNSSFIADELKKLLDLKSAGALTEVEFQSQKTKLLGN
jgi:hypothetical protein